MIAPVPSWPRWAVPAAVAGPLGLALIAVAAYRTVGAVAAIMLVGIGSAVIVGALLALARRTLRAAADEAVFAARALDALPQAVFVVDTLAQGRPNRYVNGAYAALTGYGIAEATSDAFDALSVFADPAGVAALESELDTTRASRITMRRRDGALMGAKLALRVVALGEGERWLIGVLEPVDSTVTSDRRARTRPALVDVSNVAAGRPKDAFLSAFSHDLRSPLNACTMWLDVLALAPQPDKLTQAVDAIKRNLAKQTRLVNDLNDAAKVAANGLEVRLEPIDVVALVRRHVDAWQLLAIGKQLTFHHHIEPASARVEGDPERLTQALNHLVENSISSTPSGGRVELRVRNTKDACILELEDTGTAMSAEDVANLHAPLWRAPASAKTRPGLGLGLAVAHHLAERHGGTLSAVSKSSGASFTLTLPRADSRETLTRPVSVDGGDR